MQDLDWRQQGRQPLDELLPRKAATLAATPKRTKARVAEPHGGKRSNATCYRELHELEIAAHHLLKPLHCVCPTSVHPFAQLLLNIFQLG